jgi:hypothetical protein
MSGYIKQLVKAVAFFDDAYYEARMKLARALTEETSTKLIPIPKSSGT